MRHLLFFAISCTTFFTHLSAQNTPKIVASGFDKGLIGVEVDASGNIWATEHGTGNDDGRVTIIDPAGNKTLFMKDLPSTYNQAAGEVAGSFRTYQMPNGRVMVLVGEGTNANSESLMIMKKSDFKPGTPLTPANAEEIIKIGPFVRSNGFMNCDPFHATWDPFGNIYVADAGANSILKWDKITKAFSIVKTLDRTPNPLPFGPPMIDPVPTKILLKPDSTFYVCQLTGFPFLPGSSKIYNLDAKGNLSTHAAGFTCITDINFDPKDKNLCALQFGEFGKINDTTFNFKLGSAMVIKLLPGGKRDTIARGIGGLSPSFNFDGKGGLFVTDLVFGNVLKFDLTSNTQNVFLQSADVKAFPNPFTTQLNFSYELKQSTAVLLEIYDLNGRSVALLDEGERSAGQHNVTWNSPTQLPTGTYVYRLTAGGELATGLVQFAGQ